MARQPHQDGSGAARFVGGRLVPLNAAVAIALECPFLKTRGAAEGFVHDAVKAGELRYVLPDLNPHQAPTGGTLSDLRLDFEGDGTARFGDDAVTSFGEDLPTVTVLIPRHRILVHMNDLRDIIADFDQSRRLRAPKAGRPAGPWQTLAHDELAAWVFACGLPERPREFIHHLLELLAHNGLTPEQRTVERWMADRLAAIKVRIEVLGQ